MKYLEVDETNLTTHVPRDSSDVSRDSATLGKIRGARELVQPRPVGPNTFKTLVVMISRSPRVRVIVWLATTLDECFRPFLPLFQRFHALRVGSATELTRIEPMTDEHSATRRDVYRASVKTFSNPEVFNRAVSR